MEGFLSTGDRLDESNPPMSATETAKAMDVQEVLAVLPPSNQPVCTQLPASAVEDFGDMLMKRVAAAQTDAIMKAIEPLIIPHLPWRSWG